MYNSGPPFHAHLGSGWLLSGCYGIADDVVCTPRPTLDNTIPTLVIQGDVCAATMWNDVQGWAQYEDGGVADNSDGSEWLTFKVPDGSERLVVLFGESNSDIPVNMREVNTYYTDYESHNPQYTRNDKP